jgi:hypothetical protein
MAKRMAESLAASLSYHGGMGKNKIIIDKISNVRKSINLTISRFYLTSMDQ